jgi:hypothetical protein
MTLARSLPQRIPDSLRVLAAQREILRLVRTGLLAETQSRGGSVGPGFSYGPFTTGQSYLW